MNTPFLIEWARAARDRGFVFVAEMPQIMAQYDDGDDSGRVVVVGPGAVVDGEQTVRTRIPGARDTYEVSARCLTVDAATAAHLARQLAWLEMAATRPVLTGGGARAVNFYQGAAR